MKTRNLFAAGGVLLVTAVVGLLPVFLSSGWMQSLVLARLNERIPGTISVQSCSIGWQQELQCKNIVYDDAQQGTHVDIPALSGSHGLLALIVAPMNPGTFSVHDPVLMLPAFPATVQKKSAAAVQPNNTSGSTGQGRPKSLTATSDDAPFWDKLNVKVLADGAVVKLVPGNQAASSIIRNGSLDARLTTGSIYFSMDLESGRGEGTAAVSGFVNLPVRRGGLLDTLISEINLHIMDLEVEPLLALVPAQFNLPATRGELSSELLIKAAGSGNLQISGTNMLRNITMSGGFFAEEHPSFKQINLDLDLQRDAGSGWRFPGMQVASDFGTLDLSGSVEGRTYTVKGRGKLDLPVLFEQLPHLFKVQPDIRVEDGSMDITLDFVQDQQRFAGVVGAVIDNISGNRQGLPFSWNNRINLHLDGSMENGKARIEALTLKAPFLDLEGRGELRDFSMHGTADLGLAGQEIGKIFQLGWDCGGSLRLSLESKEDGNERYLVNSRVDIADLTLSRRGKPVLLSNPLTFSSQLTTPAHFPLVRSEAMNLVFDFSSWPGKVNGEVNNVYRKDGLISAGYQFHSALQLGRLTDLLHNGEMLNPDTTLTGTANIQSSGYVEDNRLVVRELDGRVDDFIMYQQGKMYQDSLIHLFTTAPVVDDDVAQAVRALDLADSAALYFTGGGGCTMFDPAEHRLILRDLKLTSDLVDINVARLAVEDLQKLPAGLSLKLAGKTDLTALTPILQQYGFLSPVQMVDGTGSFTMDLAADNEKSYAGSVQVDCRQASFSQDGKMLLTDETVHCSSRFQGNPATGDIDFDQLTFQSSPLNLKARGRLQRSGKEPYFSLKGDMTPDFSSLIPLLNNLYATDIKAAGRQQQPFSLHYPLAVAGEDNYRRMQFSTAFNADYLSTSGIDLQKPVMPVSMENGILQAMVTAEINNGVLKVSPRLDLTLSPPLLTLPEAEQVLTKVQLEGPLIDDVLQRINPVFGLLARPVGTISAEMNHFSWPLVAEGAADADFSTVLHVGEIELAADGVLHEILVMAGLGEEPLTLQQSEITCNGAQGRISCTPLQILAADSEMTLEGSVGFDGSLDYLLEIPVTNRLVGKEAYRVLKGTTLKVPIRGSSEQAIFDPAALSRAISDLLGQAADKAAGRVIEEQVDKILPGLLDGLMGH